MRNCLFLLLVFLLSTLAKAQHQTVEDSLYEVRKQELTDAVNYDYDVIKIDAFGLLYGNVNFIYEHRQNLNFSYIGDFYFNYRPPLKGLGLSGGLRYYFDLEKRILDNWHKKKIKTSCLAGDYFQLDAGIYNHYGSNYHENHTNGIYVAPTLKLGMQRASKSNRIFWEAWVGYQVPWPDNRPYDDRIIKFGLFKFGFALGLGI